MGVKNTGNLLTGPNFGTPVVVNGQTTSLATGSLTTLARADHVHTVSNVPVLLASTTLASAAASITFSSIPQTYAKISVMGGAITNYTGGAYEWLVWKFNNDTGSNYVTTGGTFTNLYQSYAASNSNFSGLMPSIFVHDIINYASTTYHKAMVAFASVPISSTATGYGIGSSAWKQTAAITSITITLEHSGNFQAGTSVQLYGYP